KLREAGVYLEDDSAVFQFAMDGLYAYLDRLSSVVREHVPDATVFFNGTVTPLMSAATSFQTHLEIESLPTASHAWGYMHYPIMVRQARTYGLQFLGMTGRFHKSWADFGGLKTHDQLDYECGVVVGGGGRISVGDQLHPSGVLDPAVYRLLSHSFGRIEALEPWMKGSTPTAEVAILRQSKPASGLRIPGHSDDLEGAAQLFLETGIQFDILDATAPTIAHYKALVLPDDFTIDPSLKTKLEAFVADGGKLVLSGTAALDAEHGTFALDGVPVTYVAPAPTIPSYLRLDQTLVGTTELATDYDYAFYMQAHQVQPVEGARAYGTLRRALFNRTWEHFTSHAQAPVGESLGTPLVVANDSVLYFAAPFFAAHRNHDYWVYREVALNALRSFLAAPLLQASGPGWAELTLHTQPATDEHPDRQIVHIVTYHPRRTLQGVPHVDQSWPTAGISVKVLALTSTPQQVYLAPERQPLDFKRVGDYIRIDLPPVDAHTVLVLE
ncbi:MAG TPA: beta-galactosidase trimerization domain-containing protein, partial [Ktedonobacteraceae bacterium]